MSTKKEKATVERIKSLAKKKLVIPNVLVPGSLASHANKEVKEVIRMKSRTGGTYRYKLKDVESIIKRFQEELGAKLPSVSIDSTSYDVVSAKTKIIFVGNALKWKQAYIISSAPVLNKRDVQKPSSIIEDYSNHLENLLKFGDLLKDEVKDFATLQLRNIDRINISDRTILNEAIWIKG